MDLQRSSIASSSYRNIKGADLKELKSSSTPAFLKAKVKCSHMDRKLSLCVCRTAFFPNPPFPV